MLRERTDGVDRAFVDLLVDLCQRMNGMDRPTSLKRSCPLIFDRVPWPVVDLRVDWTETDPIDGLQTIWNVYKPQIDAYTTRALNPDAAPSYNVPGVV